MRSGQDGRGTGGVARHARTRRPGFGRHAGSVGAVSPRTDPAERLVDLVLALTDRRLRMTKPRVRELVRGYAEAKNDAAFERMFELDKDTLRELGVPVTLDADLLDETDVAYRIDTADWAMPEVRLTPEESAVLALAAEAWHGAEARGGSGARHADLATPARRAVTKLRAVATSVAAPTPTSLAVRLGGPGSDVGPVLDAVAARRPLTFTYVAASTGERTVRHVEPWRVVLHDGGWYVVGHDRDRGAPRAFRLSRIRGRVRADGPDGTVTVPPDVDARGLITRTGGRTGPARVAVLPGRAASLRARALPDGPGAHTAGDGTASPDGSAPQGALADRDLLTLPDADVEELADTVAAYGDAVLVLDPPALRDAVVRRLESIARLGAGDAGEG